MCSLSSQYVLVLDLLLLFLVLLGPAGELVHGTVEAERLTQSHEGRGGHHGLNNSEQILHKSRKPSSAA
jgi:hypothetical protein